MTTFITFSTTADKNILMTAALIMLRVVIMKVQNKAPKKHISKRRIGISHTNPFIKKANKGYPHNMFMLTCFWGP